MKAQFVYEKIKFERGKNPKSSLGIGKRAQIERWFKEWAPDAQYVIEDDLSVNVGGDLYLGKTSIESLPQGLSVGGILDLSGSSIESLPEGLSVGGSLDLEGTSIKSLKGLVSEAI